jgi:ABC-type branched-subunit amino acid transport system substrate-binding protein
MLRGYHVLRRSWLRLLCVLLLGSLVAAACGSDRSDGASDDGSTETTAAPSGSQSFGDLESPCGEGDAKGATAQGVTDSAITIGYGDDRGFASSPGLNHEVGDAIEAAIKWCNDQGGINGRTIDGKFYDAKITEVTNVMTEACTTVFMLVGEGWALDAGGEQKRVECGLGAVPGYSVSAAFAMGPDMMQGVPNPTDFAPMQMAAAIAKAFPKEIKKSAVVYANYSATIETKDKVLATYPKFGYEFLPCPQQYAITGEADWKPFVQKLKDCGALAVYFTGSPYPNFENFLEAADQLDFKPIYTTDANFYDESFAKWNSKGLADKVYVREAYPPLTEADSNEAIAKYIEILDANGGDKNQLGEQAMSSFLLWATAAKACGSKLTKECIFSEISKIKDWTAGGLHAPTNPASNKPPSCGVTLKLEGTKFVRFDPKEEGKLDCSDDYVAEVKGKVVDDAKLGPDRISTLYKK